MKNTILLICLIVSFLPQLNYAQSSLPTHQKTKLTAIYANISLIRSGFSIEDIGAEIGVNFILSNNWGGSLSLSGLQQEAKELPSNYSSGSFLGYYSRVYPLDKMKAYSFRVVRVFPSKTKKLRFGLEGGLSLVEHTTAHFAFTGVSSTFWGSSSNYKTSYFTKNTLGVSFKAKLELPVARWVGFEFAAITDINSYRSYFGGEVGLIVGLLRGKY